MPGKDHRTVSFFTLPRELRDNIYDLIYEETEGVDQSGPVTFAHWHIRATVPKARLISRKFKLEHDEASPANSRLQIADADAIVNEITSQAPEVPRLAEHSTHLTIKLNIPSFTCNEWAPRHGTHCLLLLGAENLLSAYKILLGRFTDVTSTKMILITMSSRCLKAVMEMAIEFPMLTSLEIFCNDGNTLEEHSYVVRRIRERGVLFDSTAKDNRLELLKEVCQSKLERDEAEQVRDGAGGEGGDADGADDGDDGGEDDDEYDGQDDGEDYWEDQSVAGVEAVENDGDYLASDSYASEDSVYDH